MTKLKNAYSVHLSKFHGAFIFLMISVSLITVFCIHRRVEFSHLGTNSDCFDQLNKVNIVKWPSVKVDTWDSFSAETVYNEHFNKRGLIMRQGSVNLNFGKLVKTPSKLKSVGHLNIADVLEYYSPIYPCLGEQRVGRWIDGGRWVCKPTSFSNKSVIFSIGHKGEITFEFDLFQISHANIHVFANLGEKLSSKMESREEFKYHRADISIKTDRNLRLILFKDMMKGLGINFVDLVKFDCEGCEYEILSEILRLPGVYIGQIIVTVNNVRKWLKELKQLLEAMESKGYRMFHMETSWRYAGKLHLSYVHQSVLNI